MTTGRRFVTENVPYTLKERLQYRWSLIKQSLTETIPDGWIKYIPITSDDPRYNDAWFEESIISIPGPKICINQFKEK